MNKIEKFKELKIRNIEYKEELKNFINELSFSTPELSGQFIEDGKLLLVRKDINARFYIDENDVGKLYEFLKEIFEEKQERVDNKKIAENLIKSKEKQKNLE